MKKALFLLVALIFLISGQASGHINFQGNESDVTQELMTIAERQYDKVCDLLDLKKDKIINVNIYSNLEEFHLAMNRSWSDWFICKCDYNDTIWMVSPLNPGSFHNALSVKRGLLGGIAKLLLCTKCETVIEPWILMGFSSYLTADLPEGIRYKTSFTNRLFNLISDKSNFSFQRISQTKPLNHKFDLKYKAGTENILYSRQVKEALMFSCIAFIIDTFGYDKFLAFAKNDSLENVFEISENDFENAWFEYCSKNLVLKK